MTGLDRDDFWSAHFKRERAIAAARRFISKSIADVVARSDVAEFLRRRRDPLPEGDILDAAEEAMNRWVKGRANRYRGGTR